MRKMINPYGVKANIRCASCKHFRTKLAKTGFFTQCSKRNEPTSGEDICEGYEMDEFFQKRGYKPI